MELKYCLFDPTKNMTILVETPVPAESQPFAGSALLRAEPTAEQVGFLSVGDADSEIALRMAGGEFCGNATMSAAVFYCLQNGIRDGTVRVRASGTDAPVPVSAAAAEAGYACTVEMPKPKQITEAFGCPLVVFDGISHMIVTKPMSRQTAAAEIRKRCAALGAACLGFMLFEESAKTLTPLVYVASPETLFWENSCASGSAAVGAYLAAQRGTPVELDLLEPGGTLQISASPDGTVFLRGTVLLAKKGTLDIPDFCGELPR